MPEGKKEEKCTHPKSRIIETRHTNMFIARRRRECLFCRFRITTYEIEAAEVNAMLKAAGDPRRVGQLVKDARTPWATKYRQKDW